MSNDDRVCRELARRYVEQYGEILLDENASLEAARPTPRMDGRIKRMFREKVFRRYSVGLVAAAAVLLLAVPFLDRVNEEQAHPAASSIAAATQAAAPTAQAPAEARPGEPVILPLSFALPANLTVQDVKADNGQSVYILANSELDDIVMILEEGVEMETHDGFKTTEINGHTVYYKHTPDYSIMTLKKQDVTYTLTCRHDVNSLVPLAEAII